MTPFLRPTSSFRGNVITADTTLDQNGENPGDLARVLAPSCAPPGFRTQNLRIKSPLLCR